MDFVQARTSREFTLTVRDPDTGRFPVAEDVEVRVSVFLLGKVPHIDPQETPVRVRASGFGLQASGEESNADPEARSPESEVLYEQLLIDAASVFQMGVPNFRHTFPAGDASPFQIATRQYIVRYHITSKSGTVQEFPIRVECY